jgi:hypothetical protein
MRCLVRSWRKLTLHPRAYGWFSRPKPAWAVTAATTWTTITASGREAGTMTSWPGSWVARSNGGDYLGTLVTQRAARRVIE